MSDNVLFYIGCLFGGIVGISTTALVVDNYYNFVTKDGWKCTNARIIDEDPSKTECTVYKRNNLNG